MPRRRARPPVAASDNNIESSSNGFQPDVDEGLEDRFEALPENGDEVAGLIPGDQEEEELEVEEYEELRETPSPRRETRQELLGRLMRRLLFAREQVHTSLEQVRDFNTEIREAGSRPPEKLKEEFHSTIGELSHARREENFARSELIQMLGWRP
ncbi:MAG: hypothetical protein HY650_03840 [Acidobacteria bacterium]|nr:hypothetical protein [Acidobacteriota bacterium]